MKRDRTPVRTLLVDNYDSYTYNLFHLLAVVNGVEPVVVRNDQGDWNHVLDRIEFDNIVISPGPGRPENPADMGMSTDAIAWARDRRVPLLGVCLGHQGLAVAYGAHTTPATRIMHGRLSRVRHNGALLTGLPQDFDVVRYHSLAVAEPMPPGLIATAWAEDGTVMALEATDAPLFGVQFHPESILTTQGRHIIEAFRNLTPASSYKTQSINRPTARKPRQLHLTVERRPGPVDAELLFSELRQAPAVWLDSAGRGPDSGRFSYLICGQETVHHSGEGNVFDYLADQLGSVTVTEPPDLPFDFVGGYVGYLGYESVADTATDSPYRSEQPDAALLFANRIIVVDHVQDDVYLVALDPENGDLEQTHTWIATTAELIERLRNGRPLAPPGASPASIAHPVRGRERYLEDIAAVQRYLRAGETYEACLTTRFDVTTQEEPFEVYRRLRRSNPAPYAAFLDFGSFAVSSSSPERFLRVTRSGRVSAKPIKGTRPRGSTPAEDRRLAEELGNDPKERAENLMIVDLLRNDLGRVCRTGSVVVPRLMEVESFSTVHQLVSTVEGDLGPGRTAVDCVRAAFPGGSMTGAPKVRTMRILQELEGRARGVYSGVIGFFGVNGTADLSIVIRTLVHTANKVSVGAGGAITTLSDPEQEWREVRLKADAVLPAVNALTSDDDVVAGIR